MSPGTATPVAAATHPATLAIAAQVAEAAGSGRALRVEGHARWTSVLARVRPGASALAVRPTAGVRELVPGDLTITVGAGTTIGELRAATAAHGQWCPLDPWGDDEATVGAVLATATAGPWADALGRPRDLTLGVEFVDGAGRVVRAGGRVVKNVAGFDLTRLLVGAWGTLGVLTEASLRLRAVPTCDESWLVPLDGAVPDALRDWARGPLGPLGWEVLDGARSAACGLAAAPQAVVRLAGNAAAVAASRAALRGLADLHPADPALWQAVRSTAPDRGVPPWRWPSVARRIRDRFDPAGILNPGLLDSAPEGA